MDDDQFTPVRLEASLSLHRALGSSSFWSKEVA
jgi:hypothetical protein